MSLLRTLESSGLPTHLPLVGRDEELAAIDRLRRDRGGPTSAVFLSGDPGVGKSRLASELMRRAAEDGWVVAHGRAYPVESGVPYALFADAFLPMLRAMEPARLTVLSRGGEHELRQLFPALNRGVEGPEVSGDPDEHRTRLHWNFTEFLKAWAKQAPVLCVLEDLQWADRASLELLHFLVRQVRGTPIFVVGTRHDVDPGADQGCAETERSLMLLGAGLAHRVAPLTAEAVTALLMRTFGAEEGRVGRCAARLHAWTKGNAFFTEEVLKSMVGSGTLRREGEAWVGFDGVDLAVPRPVRDTVLARVASFSDAARRLLDLAAVVGARVRYPVLAQLADLSEDVLIEALEELGAHRILEEREEAGAVVYLFGHPMVREIVYGELGLLRRRVLHGRVAEVLESLHGPAASEHADELAYHFARAGDATLRARATGYLVEAGRRALERRAPDEAVRYLEEAVAGLPSRPDAPKEADGDALASNVHALLARAHQQRGDYGAAVERWKSALSTVPPDDPSAVDFRRGLGLAHFWLGRHDDAERHLREGLALAESTGQGTSAIRLRIALAHGLHEVGRGRDALDVALPALAAADQTGDPSLQARVHRTLALLYLWVGPPAKTREHGESALRLAERTGDVSVEFWARWALAVSQGLRGGEREMEREIRALAKLAERSRSPVLRLWATELAIEFAYGRGDWDVGAGLGAEAIELARGLHQTALLPRLLVWTSQFHLARGDFERARELVDEAVGVSGLDRPARVRDVHQVVPAAIGLAHYRIATGDWRGAIDVAEEGVRIAEGTGYMLWAVHRLLPVLAEACLWEGEIDRAAELGARLREHAQALDHSLGIAWADACDAFVCWKQGDPAGAVGLMRRAADVLERIPMVPYAARIRRQLAGRLLEVGAVDEAVAELERVHETCARLGAGPELEKTRAMFAEAGRPVPIASSADTWADLTPREVEVARLVGRRCTNEQIGRTLGISPRTASTHLSNIYKKLGVESRGALVDLVRERFAPPPPGG